MDIAKHYNLLMNKRKLTEPEGITELHHIIPRCLGGTDNAENLVRLSPREHYVAHWMLTKMYNSSKISYAFLCMIRDPHGYRTFNSHYYDRVKKVLAQTQRDVFLTDNPMWRQEVKRKISDSKMGSKNPQYQSGAKNSNAYPVTVIFKDGKQINYTHGKAAYEDLQMSRATWINGLRNKKFNNRWNIEKVIKR